MFRTACLLGLLTLLIATSATGQTLMLNDGEKGFSFKVGLGMTDDEISYEGGVLYTLSNHFDLGASVLSVPVATGRWWRPTTSMKTAYGISANLYTKPRSYERTSLIFGIHGAYMEFANSDFPLVRSYGASMACRIPIRERGGVLFHGGYFGSERPRDSGAQPRHYTTVGLTIYGPIGAHARLGFTSEYSIAEGPDTMVFGFELNFGR